MENKKTGSVFLQTDRDYINYAMVLREVIYMSLNAEKIVQKLYPEFIINPVMVDDEILITGSKKWDKRLIGFNYNELNGFAYYIIYSSIYLIAKQYGLKWYFDGYISFWEKDSHANSWMVNLQKTLDEKTPDKKKNISMTFWELKLFFERQFSKTSF